MNEKEINRIVEETIHSIDNVKITVPDDILFQKIMTGIKQNEKSFFKENSYAGKYIIVFAVLVLLNIFSIIVDQKAIKKTSANDMKYYLKGINEFSRTYFSSNDEYSY
ncbi:MAG TPA: hypothetical protein PKC91_02430 [Ignavibacteria bacterium]|nr:hypothetical protein [Ignavibacteria bacterium]